MARQRGNKWQADVRLQDGSRLRKSFETQEGALSWEAQVSNASAMGKPIPAPRNMHQSNGTRDLTNLGKLFDHTCRTEWSKMKGARTLIPNGKTVCDFFGRNRDINTITSADIADFKIHLADNGLSTATVNRKVAALSKMFSVARDAGAIDAVPVIKWNAEVKTRFRYLDDREERALLAYWLACGYQDYHDLTALLIDTGARCFSEMIPVRWDAFSPRFTAVTFWETKTNKPRTVPLTKRCRDILNEIRRLDKDTTGPFTSVHLGGVRSRWDTMRAALGLRDVTPHTLRHTCCTRLVLGGVDVKRVMEWMGHSAIVTTMRYMQIKPNALEDVLHILEGKHSNHPTYPI